MQTPIACSLSAAEMPVRRKETAALGRGALLRTHVGARHAQLRFAPGSRPRVDAFVAAESSCCPFFAMHVTEEQGAVVLDIDAPEGAERVLRELVDAFGAAR